MNCTIKVYSILDLTGHKSLEPSFKVNMCGLYLPGKDGVGVPVGGLEGQILAKKSSKDFDTEWVDTQHSEYLEYIIDDSYTYEGYDGANYVSLPYGCFYPVNGYFDGVDYDFVLEVYINDELLEKGTHWREANSQEGDGFLSYSESYLPGLGSYAGFAHMIILIKDITIHTGDTVRMKVKKRILTKNCIFGLRLTGNNLTDVSYHYGINVKSQPISADRIACDTIHWAFPKSENCKIIGFHLPKYTSGRYYSKSKPDPNARIHQGKIWRPCLTIDSSAQSFSLINTHKRQLKLAVFDVLTGAISKLENYTLIRKADRQFLNSDGDPLNMHWVLR